MEAILDWISTHREWVLIVVLVIAVGETLPVLSLFVPATTILVLVGGLISTGKLDMLPVFAGAAGGAFLGSVISWACGRCLGPRLLRMSIMRRHSRQLRSARRAFKR